MGSTCLPELVPWQRRQFSYWFTAGVSTVTPSVALMPATSFCETRISGGGGKTPTAWDPWPLWQSTQVAWRLLLSRALSAASCGLVELGNGCPIFGEAYSAKTFVVRAAWAKHWRRCGTQCRPAHSGRAAAARHSRYAARGRRCRHCPRPWNSCRRRPEGVILAVERAWALAAQSASGFTCAADLPRGIVAGQAHLAAGAVR